jgi:addiction module HigA family antidote
MSRKAVSQLVNGHARITPPVALRLAQAFSNSAEGWMDMQTRRDLWVESRRTGKLRVPVLHGNGRKVAHR